MARTHRPRSDWWWAHPRSLTELEFNAGQLAERVLGESRLVVASFEFRPLEVEFYYRGDGCVDPFAHGHPVQAIPNRFYFHRIGKGYRGGSFKGLDLTFGSEGRDRGGMLLRTLQGPDGQVVSGPSKIVDRLLELSGADSVADLDRSLQAADDRTQPLYFELGEGRSKEPILRSARVGLSLRSPIDRKVKMRWVMAPLRFLIRPRLITKGRTQIATAFHRDGRSIPEIVERTGIPLATVRRRIDDYQRGRTHGEIERFFGRILRAREIAEVDGAWNRVFGV